MIIRRAGEAGVTGLGGLFQIGGSEDKKKVEGFEMSQM